MSALSPTISRDDFKDVVRELLRADPGLHAQLVELFYREGAPYEPRRVFEYLFIAHEASAVETPSIIRFRAREPEERALAIAAFDAENRDAARHTKTPNSRLRQGGASALCFAVGFVFSIIISGSSNDVEASTFARRESPSPSANATKNPAIFDVTIKDECEFWFGSTVWRFENKIQRVGSFLACRECHVRELRFAVLRRQWNFHSMWQRDQAPECPDNEPRSTSSIFEPELYGRGGIARAGRTLNYIESDSIGFNDRPFKLREGVFTNASLIKSGFPESIGGPNERTREGDKKESKNSQQPVREFGGPKFVFFFLVLCGLTVVGVASGRACAILACGFGLLALVFGGWAGLI